MRCRLLCFYLRKLPNGGRDHAALRYGQALSATQERDDYSNQMVDNGPPNQGHGAIDALVLAVIRIVLI